MIPHLTFYTDQLPEGVAGAANGPVIRIRPEHRHDAGILKHEQEHVRQWWLLATVTAPLLYIANPALTGLAFGAHPVLYLAVRKYRLWCEVRAYRIQMQHPDKQRGFLSLAQAAKHLTAPRYRLALTLAQAESALR